MAQTLFPTDLAALQWEQFPARGFAEPVAGVIYRADEPPCCGLPLGGIGTGCVDLDARGVLGFASLFNPAVQDKERKDVWLTRKVPHLEPLLGLAVDGKTWVLVAPEVIRGELIDWCTEPRTLDALRPTPRETDKAWCPRLEGVEPATQIRYWGHYPVADLEFTTTAPIGVGLRAFCPFIPGDAAASSIPAIVFQVELRNDSAAKQAGSIVLNFQGPDCQEAGSSDFTRQRIEEEFQGMLVAAPGQVNYVLGVIGSEQVRFGAGLTRAPGAWTRIGESLPEPAGAFREEAGVRLFQDGSCAAAVDFALEPGHWRQVRFVLAWFAPHWQGVTRTWPGRDEIEDGLPIVTWIGSRWASDTHHYTHMYAARYGSALDVARRMAADHQTLLDRVISWQQVVYSDQSMPLWLRDSLVNNLCQITECSYWAQARPPLGDWVFPGGAFAMNESPRACPQIACILCDWYGNLPIVFFFPELARSTLRLFKQYQHTDGQVPFAIGRSTRLPDLATPRYFQQVSLNGMCYIDMLDRLWQRTGDQAILREFYDSAKRCNTYTMNLRRGPGGVISMPEMGGMEWFEHGEWAGIATHMGGLRLAQLRMMQRMAEAMGDDDYARQCQLWFEDGTSAMEQEMWTGSYYLNFYEKETGKKSDDVMAYQFDGQWAALFHGLEGVFRPDRVTTSLKTIRRCNVALTPQVGAANFARPDGSPLPATAKVAEYGPCAVFPAQVVLLGMTAIYAGDRSFGLDLVKRCWASAVLQNRYPWDLPNFVPGRQRQALLRHRLLPDDDALGDARGAGRSGHRHLLRAGRSDRANHPGWHGLIGHAHGPVAAGDGGHGRDRPRAGFASGHHAGCTSSADSVARQRAARPVSETAMMKNKEQLDQIIRRIASADSPVGMDAVYVHALIIDKLTEIEQRLDALEQEAAQRRARPPDG